MRDKIEIRVVESSQQVSRGNNHALYKHYIFKISGLIAYQHNINSLLNFLHGEQQTYTSFVVFLAAVADLHINNFQRPHPNGTQFFCFDIRFR